MYRPYTYRLSRLTFLSMVMELQTELSLVTIPNHAKSKSPPPAWIEQHLNIEQSWVCLLVQGAHALSTKKI